MSKKTRSTKSPLITTFSIVAADPTTQQVGVAVQSKFFAVGSVVPWGRSGVGAVATQARGLARYGRQLLDALESGQDPQTALKSALADDPLAEQRQIGIVTAGGLAANHTGAECPEWAGARSGPGFSVQGNLLAGEAVVDNMAEAFTSTQGSLAERMMASLEAGQAAGGDRRGQQSAAMIVDQHGFRDIGPGGIDRLVNLRVDDHPEAIKELRRLFGLWEAEYVNLEAILLYNQEDLNGAMKIIVEANQKYPDNARILYNLACFESLSGSTDESLEHLKQAIGLDPSMREFAQTDADFDAIRDTPAFSEITTA